jgi:hypothetical protein
MFTAARYEKLFYCRAHSIQIEVNAWCVADCFVISNHEGKHYVLCFLICGVHFMGTFFFTIYNQLHINLLKNLKIVRKNFNFKRIIKLMN